MVQTLLLCPQLSQLLLVVLHFPQQVIQMLLIPRMHPVQRLARCLTWLAMQENPRLCLDCWVSLMRWPPPRRRRRRGCWEMCS